MAEVPEDFHYGDDGDCIPGLPHEVQGMGHASMAMVGRCYACGEKFWALEVFLHENPEPGYIMELLADEPEWTNSYMLPDQSAMWTAHEMETPDGKGYVHFIGPLAPPADAVTHGANGVSACGGGDFWKHARKVASEVLPQVMAVTKAIRDRTGTASVG